MGAAKVLEELGTFEPGVVDRTLVDEELLLRKDDNHIVKTAAHDFTPIVKTGRHHTVAQPDTLTAAGSRTA